MLRMFEHLGRAKEPLTFIRDNEDFFMRVTINKLDERVNGLTRYTDGATYINEQLFQDKYGAYVPWLGMSTGGKTVLNVFYNPEFCFNTAECGENAAADLKNLKQGCIYPAYIVDYDGDDRCEVILDDNPDWVYTSVKEVFQ